MSRLLSLALLALPSAAVAAPPSVTAVAYHPDGKSVAFGLRGEVRIFDTTSGEARDTLRVVGRVTALAFDARGAQLAVASAEPGKVGFLHFIAVQGSGRLEPGKGDAISAHKDSIYALAFSPDGKTLATAGYDRVIHLWNVPVIDKPVKEAKVEPRLTLKDHSDTVYGLSFHPDGKLLASAGADRAVKVWEVATGKRLYTLADATEWVYAVAWSPDKKHLAAAGVDKSIRVWAADADGGKLVHSVFAHEKPVWRLAYSGDGKTLFSVGEDRVVKLWDSAKMTESKVFDAQPDAILDFAVRFDAKQLALARFDGVGVLLDPATGKVTAQPLPEKPVPPKPEKLTPNGGVRGKTTRVTVSGTSLDQVQRVTTNSPDVKVKFDSALQNPTKLQLDVTIGSKVPLGLVQLTFEGEAGKSAPVVLAVDRFPSVAEVGATDSARTAMIVKPSTTITGVVDRPGDVDYFRFEAKIGDQIGAQVIASEVRSKLDPVLVLTDENGTVLAEGGTSLGFVVRTPGTFAMGIRDREFRGGADFSYRLHLGEVPVITGVFPLAAQRGRMSTVHIKGVNLAPESTSVTVKVTVPADAVPGSRVPVPLAGDLAKALGSPSVVVSEFPSVVMDPIAGADIRVPGSADGILTKPNDTQTAHFTAKKGQRLVVEVLASRAGSPVDPVIEILDAAGKPLPLAVLRCTAKTSVTFRDHDSRSPGIRLDAWNELAIDDYLYVNGDLMRILALPRGPDDDCQFYQVAGQRLGFLGTTPTHHSQGEPMYKVELHPPGKTFPPNGFPLFTLNHRNDDGGAGYGKDSRLFFDVPADGSYQVRVTDARGSFGPAHSFRVTVRPPTPDYTVSLSAPPVSMWKGGAIPVSVTVNRLDGFDGPVNVKLEGLPEGFSAPPTFIEAGQTATTFALFTAPDAMIPDKPQFKLVASATIDGKQVKREVTGTLPKKIAGGDIVTTVRVQTITIVPGKETRFTVDIVRQGKFTGRVPVEVKGLPHGVRVLNVGLNGILITERETSREVVLYAEPWVKPMEHPIVLLAKREGTNNEHAAKSVLLKVEK